jgi:hypothetical protein
MVYDVSARSYLERANDCLLERSQKALFYAAFELRCSVEARQAQYIDAMKRYTKMKRTRSWEIGKSQRELEKIFRDGKMIVKLRIASADSDFYHESYYTPVSKQLANDAERLGEYLHARRHYVVDNDPWWSEIRSYLIEIYGQAWISCRGNILAPPLIHPGTGKITNSVIEFTREESMQLLRVRDLDGKLEYLSAPPPEWNADL